MIISLLQSDIRSVNCTGAQPNKITDRTRTGIIIIHNIRYDIRQQCERIQL